ncbi:MAG TPA: FAD-binding protein [bacterium]|nr:FAD-binding protein [bacterium]
MSTNYDVIVIGAGPAGLAAAIEAKKAGARTLVVERNNEAGGILPQCIHNGFGSVIFKKDLPGPLYASYFMEEAEKAGVEMLFDTMALDITPWGLNTEEPENRGGQRGSAVPTIRITATNKTGFLELKTKALVLATGCRERTRSQIRLPGTRPAGVFTAGTVQRMVNIEGFMPGKNFVILGSGDIGMIMARRLTLEGAKVIKVIELLPYLTGLRRNYVQCLQDFNIPLELSTTISRINGKDRVESVTTVKAGEGLLPIAGSEEDVPCDTLLLSAGLIPENELAKKAGIILDPLTGGPVVDENMAVNIPGIFAAGNSVTIYDLVDYVSKAGYIAGRNAADYAAGKTKPAEYIEIRPGENVRNVIPQRIHKKNAGPSEIMFELRVSREFPEKCSVNVMDGDAVLYSKKEKYARPAEMLTLRLDSKSADALKNADNVSITVSDLKKEEGNSK